MGTKSKQVETKRKQLGTNRDQVCNKREQVGMKRKQVGNKREQVRTKRKQVGNKREQVRTERKQVFRLVSVQFCFKNPTTIRLNPTYLYRRTNSEIKHRYSSSVVADRKSCSSLHRSKFDWNSSPPKISLQKPQPSA